MIIADDKSHCNNNQNMLQGGIQNGNSTKTRDAHRAGRRRPLRIGAYPRTHGVTCYTNHTWGKRLDKVEANWDSRRVEAELIWETFSEQGRRSIMMNYCQAWPPRSLEDKSIYIDGTGTIPFMRCNAEPQKLVTLKEGDFELTFIPHAMKKGNADCVVTGEQFEEMVSQSEEEDDPNGFQRKVEYFPEVVFRGSSLL